MPTLKKGKDLNYKECEQVFNAFPYRWTRDNTQRVRAYGPCPLCNIEFPYENSKSAEGHKHPTIPLISDAQWLQEYAFYFNKDGSLSKTHQFAEPHYLADNQ